MASEKITALPTVPNSLAADIIYAVQGGVSVQETLQQVLNLNLSNTILNYNGDPNTNVAGKTYQLCWDTVNEILYICTTTGSSSTAVWAQITAGSGTFDWVTVSGTSATMGVNTGYIANNGSLVTLTMPSTSNVGDEIIVYGLGSGGWRIAQPTGVQIYYSPTNTTLGVGGSLSSTNAKDVVKLNCILTNTTWSVCASQTAGLTVV